MAITSGYLSANNDSTHLPAEAENRAGTSNYEEPPSQNWPTRSKLECPQRDVMNSMPILAYRPIEANVYVSTSQEQWSSSSSEGLINQRSDLNNQQHHQSNWCLVANIDGNNKNAIEMQECKAQASTNYQHQIQPRHLVQAHPSQHLDQANTFSSRFDQQSYNNNDKETTNDSSQIDFTNYNEIEQYNSQYYAAAAAAATASNQAYLNYNTDVTTCTNQRNYQTIEGFNGYSAYASHSNSKTLSMNSVISNGASGCGLYPYCYPNVTQPSVSGLAQEATSLHRLTNFATDEQDHATAALWLTSQHQTQNLNVINSNQNHQNQPHPHYQRSGDNQHAEWFEKIKGQLDPAYRMTTQNLGPTVNNYTQAQLADYSIQAQYNQSNPPTQTDISSNITSTLQTTRQSPICYEQAFQVDPPQLSSSSAPFIGLKVELDSGKELPVAKNRLSPCAPHHQLTRTVGSKDLGQSDKALQSAPGNQTNCLPGDKGQLTSSSSSSSISLSSSSSSSSSFSSSSFSSSSLSSSSYSPVTSVANCVGRCNDRLNQCRICGRHYARPSTLKTHLRTHTNERPYKCRVCCKTFSQAANLTAHQRVHTGERPFPCPVCRRQFSQSSSVITHLRTHSGERPYRCKLCNKTFSDSSTLTKHCRIHSGEKPYQCDYCPMNFSQSGNLSRHLRLHLLNNLDSKTSIPALEVAAVGATRAPKTRPVATSSSSIRSSQQPVQSLTKAEPLSPFSVAFSSTPQPSSGNKMAILTSLSA